MTAIRYVRGVLPGIPGEHDIAVLDGDTHISKWVEESRRLDHDQNTLPRIGALIGPESVVYDVGAFIGDHTAFYASRARTVLAFEVNPDVFDCLSGNVRRYPNVSVFGCPVGDGESIDLVQDDNAGASRVRQYPGIWVSLRLDDLEAPPPTLIKLDIEGWEVRALRGAVRTIRDHRPIIVCEVNRTALERAGTSPAELHALLTSYGYSMRDIFTEEPWMSDDPRPQFDVVAMFQSSAR